MTKCGEVWWLRGTAEDGWYQRMVAKEDKWWYCRTAAAWWDRRATTNGDVWRRLVAPRDNWGLVASSNGEVSRRAVAPSDGWELVVSTGEGEEMPGRPRWYRRMEANGSGGCRRWMAGMTVQRALTWKSLCAPSAGCDTHRCRSVLFDYSCFIRDVWSV